MTKALTHPLDVALGCRCGRVRGVASHVSPATGFRFVCYCNDCQVFARFLDRRDVLNAAGDTDIFQMPPGRVRLSAGTDALRCLQLSNKVLRWYSDCCQTPMANTAASPRVPMIGVIHCFMETIVPATKCWLPHLRKLCRRAAPAERAKSAVPGSFRPPCVNAARLVGARARPADAVFRRSHEGAARGAPRAHRERARRGFARPVTAVVSRSQVTRGPKQPAVPELACATAEPSGICGLAEARMRLDRAFLPGQGRDHADRCECLDRAGKHHAAAPRWLPHQS